MFIDRSAPHLKLSQRRGSKKRTLDNSDYGKRNVA